LRETRRWLTHDHDRHLGLGGFLADPDAVVTADQRTDQMSSATDVDRSLRTIVDLVSLRPNVSRFRLGD
jgi:hypothetical protein